MALPAPYMLTPAPHILVVDDNEEILSVLTLLLHRRAYEVSVKSRVEDFEREVDEIKPDLILLDHTLGWADGCELCTALKSNERFAHIPIIMFSAYNKTKDACLNAGANQFIEKPFEMQHLLSSIASFVQ